MTPTDAPLPELKARLAAAYAPGPDPAGAMACAPAPALKIGDMIAGHAGLHVRAVLATCAINLLALAGSLVVLNVYDRVLPNQAMETLTALAIGAGLAALFEFALRMLRGVLIDAASRDTDMRLASLLFGRVLGARLSAAQGATGVRINTLREFETVREFSTSATLTALGDLPFALLFVGVIWLVAGPLVAVPLIAIPLVFGLMLAINRPLARLTAESFRDTAQKNAVLVETLVGLETIKAMNAEAWAQRLWDRAVAEHVRVGLRTRLLMALGQNGVQMAQGLATLALLVYGVVLVGQGAITGGALMASMTLIARAMAPVGQGAMILGRLHQIKVAWAALKALAEAPQERPAEADFVAPSGPITRFACERVTFAYAKEAPPALSEASFAIGAGEKVALIGAIGSGKSTVLRLLIKLHAPQAGRILANGLALEGIDPALLRHEMGVVEQSPVLFSGTIRANLALHRPEARDADIIAACEVAGALDWIGRLPRGFDTRLGERGQGLSGGQRQSLALARALVGQPATLILDEPTSDMDGRSEAEVVRRLGAHLAQAAGARTLILVTHRPALLDLVDRLIVLDAGRVMADGPKPEVLELLRRQSTAQVATHEPQAKSA